MILSNHIISGALAAKYSQNLWLALPLGIAVHLVLDAIPHWDYSIENLVNKMKSDRNKSLVLKFAETFKDKKSLKDIFKISFDLFLGVSFALISALLEPNLNIERLLNFSLVIFGVLLPDILIIPSKILENKFLKKITHIHTKIIHAKNKLKIHPYGLILQILIFLTFLTLII